MNHTEQEVSKVSMQAFEEEARKIVDEMPEFDDYAVSNTAAEA